MGEKLKKAIDELKSMAIQQHYYCDDSWFSCPKTPEGCADDRKPRDVCICGAENHNLAVLKKHADILNILQTEKS